MNGPLLIRESRLFLEQPNTYSALLSLKVCIDRDIYKFHNLQWNSQCNRWQALSQMRISFHPESPIEFQLFHSADNSTKVIGEGFIAATIVKKHLGEEIKISLTYDGLIVGYLYCEFSFERQSEERKNMSNKYLYLHKISLTFMQDLEQQFRLQIMQNTEPIYNKAFSLTQRCKTIFPNIKKAVRLSDVIAIELYHCNKIVKPVIFLVDHIKRGKTTFFEAWLRNKYKNKMGNLNLEYFLENIYLQNERKVFSRKAIVPNSVEHAKTQLVAKGEQERLEIEKAKKLLMEKKIEEADKRILKVNNDLNKMINQIRINEHAMPCLRRQHSNKPEDKREPLLNKEKIPFYYPVKQ